MLNPATTTDTAKASEVCLTGTFRAVDWDSRTARFHGEDGTITTVRFTPEQDGWMRLVANIKVNLKGTRQPPTAPDASQNGQHDSEANANAHAESDYVQLTEAKVPRANWEPYDDEDIFSVTPAYIYDPDTHKTFDFGMDVDEWMRLIRGPDYQGCGP